MLSARRTERGVVLSNTDRNSIDHRHRAQQHRQNGGGGRTRYCNCEGANGIAVMILVVVILFSVMPNSGVRLGFRDHGLVDATTTNNHRHAAMRCVEHKSRGHQTP